MKTTITRKKAVAWIQARSGKFFSVKFLKRTTGELREMTCRQGVKVHLKGGPPAYDYNAKSLLPVWDTVAAGYRSIPTEGLTAVKIAGKWFDVI